MSAIFQLGRIAGRFAAHLFDRLAAWVIGDDWNRHVTTALDNLAPPEHTVRGPFVEAVKIAEDDYMLFCHDCTALFAGRYTWTGVAHALNDHRAEEHKAVTR